METPEPPGHLSIGEVLSLLQQDYEDISISKIRFLESQGLINPERTPSGYRKFREPDIERLRWILRQQKEHFLPLKVIKAKLEAGDLDEGPAVSQPELFGGPEPSGSGAMAETSTEDPAVPPGGDAPTPSEAADQPRDPGAWLAELQESPRPSRARPSRPVPAASASSGEGLRFGIADVADVTNVPPDAVATLVEYGLVATRRVGGEPTFDAAAVAVVRAAAPLLARGVEPRHLRIFKNAAEREAGFYEQMILPLLKQRNPRSREQAAETLSALVGEGASLHEALVHAFLAPHLD